MKAEIIEAAVINAYHESTKMLNDEILENIKAAFRDVADEHGKVDAFKAMTASTSAVAGASAKIMLATLTKSLITLFADEN